MASRRAQPPAVSGAALIGADRGATNASRRETTAARTSGGRSTSAWVEQVEHPQDEGLHLGHHQAHHTAPSSVRSITASGPSAVITRDDSAASTATSTSTASPEPSARLSGEGLVGVETVGELGRPGRTGHRQAVDAIDPEGTGLTAVAVPAHRVPVAAAEPDPGNVDDPGLPTVGEGHDRTVADGVEQCRKGGSPSTRGRSTSGSGAPRRGHRPPRPNLDSASLPIGSPRWTPATARLRAACSSGSSPRSGR